ncbi:diguanylate cyclase [Shewanella sp. TC10]|uniref:sensor domain-containing diguanylate cyclase n=1 Tax=Shewanella sp. TC10 TaxID=1419739 RepID=UPI001892B56F|nr:diguanylate cyclase [Shewanella sp. TC10]
MKDSKIDNKAVAKAPIRETANNHSLPSTFFKSVLDALLEQLAVIDSAGKIVFVNQSWKSFGAENKGDEQLDWQGVNYLNCCHSSAQSGDSDARIVSQGIERVLSGKEQSFSYEYPCHSPDTQRWFLMRMAPLMVEKQSYFVITHQNITQRRLAEEALAEVASKDPLVKIANRRKFEEFTEIYWKMSLRNNKPVSVVMIDIDHFKLINDCYGHSVGDKCLIELAKILDSVTRRPTDLCARYGGDEFIIFFGDLPLSSAVTISEGIMEKFRNLTLFDHIKDISNQLSFISVSIGIASATPKLHYSLNALTQKADEYLYEAKRNGRNRIAFDRHSLKGNSVDSHSVSTHSILDAKLG